MVTCESSKEENFTQFESKADPGKKKQNHALFMKTLQQSNLFQRYMQLKYKIPNRTKDEPVVQ